MKISFFFVLYFTFSFTPVFGADSAFEYLEKNDLNSFKIILPKQNLWKRNSRGETLLSRAVFLEKIDFVDLLLKHGASPYVKDKDGAFPFATILRRGKNQAIYDLLESYKYDFNHQDDFGISLVESAEEGGNQKWIAALNKNRTLQEISTNEDKAELISDLISGKIEALDNYYYRFRDLNFLDSRGKSIFYYLRMFKSVDHQKLVNKFVWFGGDLNYQDKNGHTIVMTTLRSKLIELTSFMLNYFPDLNIRDEAGRNLLHMSVQLDVPNKVIEQIINLGGLDLLLAQDVTGKTPSLLALDKDKSERFKFLVALNPHVIPLEGEDGNNLLMNTILTEQYGLSDFILTQNWVEGFDINHQNRNGNTALHLVSQKGNRSLYKSIRAFPTVRTNIKNNNNRTPAELFLDFFSNNNPISNVDINESEHNLLISTVLNKTKVDVNFEFTNIENSYSIKVIDTENKLSPDSLRLVHESMIEKFKSLLDKKVQLVLNDISASFSQKFSELENEILTEHEFKFQNTKYENIEEIRKKISGAKSKIDELSIEKQKLEQDLIEVEMSIQAQGEKNKIILTSVTKTEATFRQFIQEYSADIESLKQIYAEFKTIKAKFENPHNISSDEIQQTKFETNRKIEELQNKINFNSREIESGQKDYEKFRADNRSSLENDYYRLSRFKNELSGINSEIIQHNLYITKHEEHIRKSNIRPEITEKEERNKLGLEFHNQKNCITLPLKQKAEEYLPQLMHQKGEREKDIFAVQEVINATEKNFQAQEKAIKRELDAKVNFLTLENSEYQNQINEEYVDLKSKLLSYSLNLEKLELSLKNMYEEQKAVVLQKYGKDTGVLVSGVNDFIRSVSNENDANTSQGFLALGTLLMKYKDEGIETPDKLSEAYQSMFKLNSDYMQLFAGAIAQNSQVIVYKNKRDELNKIIEKLQFNTRDLERSELLLIDQQRNMADDQEQRILDQIISERELSERSEKLDLYIDIKESAMCIQRLLEIEFIGLIIGDDDFLQRSNARLNEIDKLIRRINNALQKTELPVISLKNFLEFNLTLNQFYENIMFNDPYKKTLVKLEDVNTNLHSKVLSHWSELLTFNESEQFHFSQFFMRAMFVSALNQSAVLKKAYLDTKESTFIIYIGSDPYWIVADGSLYPLVIDDFQGLFDYEIRTPKDSPDYESLNMLYAELKDRFRETFNSLKLEQKNIITNIELLIRHIDQNRTQYKISQAKEIIKDSFDMAAGIVPETAVPYQFYKILSGHDFFGRKLTSEEIAFELITFSLFKYIRPQIPDDDVLRYDIYENITSTILTKSFSDELKKYHINISYLEPAIPEIQVFEDKFYWNKEILSAGEFKARFDVKFKIISPVSKITSRQRESYRVITNKKSGKILAMFHQAHGTYDLSVLANLLNFDAGGIEQGEYIVPKGSKLFLFSHKTEHNVPKLLYLIP